MNTRRTIFAFVIGFLLFLIPGYFPTKEMVIDPGPTNLTILGVIVMAIWMPLIFAAFVIASYHLLGYNKSESPSRKPTIYVIDLMVYSDKVDNYIPSFVYAGDEDQYMDWITNHRNATHMLLSWDRDYSHDVRLLEGRRFYRITRVTPTQSPKTID